MKGALRTRLVGQTAVGSRVYWLQRPQTSTLPAITLQTISGDWPRTYDGMQALRDSRVQLDVWAAGFAEAQSVMQAAIAALTPVKVTVEGIFFDGIFFESERDGIERLGTTDVFRTSIDLIVWHSPA